MRRSKSAFQNDEQQQYSIKIYLKKFRLKISITKNDIIPYRTLYFSSIHLAMYSPRSKRTTLCYFITNLSQKDAKGTIRLEILLSEYECHFCNKDYQLLKITPNSIYRLSIGNTHFWHFVWIPIIKAARKMHDLYIFS